VLVGGVTLSVEGGEAALASLTFRIAASRAALQLFLEKLGYSSQDAAQIISSGKIPVSSHEKS
jgi:hypothetical protein